MNKKIILGHCNVALGIILDNLHGLYGDTLQVEIVSNILEEQNKYRDLPYKHNKIKSVEFYYDKWTPSHGDRFLLAGMGVKTKQTIYDFFLKKHSIDLAMYESIVNKDAVLGNGVTIGIGCNISPGVILAPFTSIGNFVTLNRGVIVGHHTSIGDFTTINPGSNIAGMCSIGTGVTIGMGGIVLDRLEIGDNSIIGAGALVTKNVLSKTLNYGVPAKIIRKL